MSGENKTGGSFVRQNVLPVLAAMIWGMGFVVQDRIAESLQTFTTNAARSLIAVLALFPVCLFLRRRQRRLAGGAQLPWKKPGYRRDLLLGGLFCGLALTAATNFQQKGIEASTPGKAGFITALYIVIVPIMGIFFGRRVRPVLWFSVALACAGLYFLCMDGSFTLSSSDLCLILCAFCYSAQILLIDHFGAAVSGFELSCAQFLVTAVLSAAGMALFESPDPQAVLSCLLPLVYMGVFSSGVAFTLQIVAQKGTNPTVVSLLLSLESVFAALGGALILHDLLTGRELFGCLLMLCAVVLAQLPAGRRQRT